MLCIAQVLRLRLVILRESQSLKQVKSLSTAGAFHQIQLWETLEPDHIATEHVINQSTIIS